jgi:hypothetical protein
MMRLNKIVYDKDSTPEQVKLAKAQQKDMEGVFQVIEDKTKVDDIITIHEEIIKMLRDQGGYSNTKITQLQTMAQQKLGTSQGTSQVASQSASQSGTALQRANALAPPPKP